MRKVFSLWFLPLNGKKQNQTSCIYSEELCVAVNLFLVFILRNFLSFIYFSKVHVVVFYG